MNNPVRAVDPTGHSWLDVVIGVFVVLVIVGLVALTILTAGAASPALAIAIGAAIGLAVGAVVGAVIALSLGISVTDARFWRLVIAGALIGAALGGAAGIVVGYGFVAAFTTYALTTQVLIGAGLGGLGAAISGAKHGFTDTWLLGVVLGAGLGAVVAAIGGYAGEFGVFLQLTTPSTVPLFAALGELVGVGAGYKEGYHLACNLNRERCADDGGILPEPSTPLTYGSQSSPLIGTPSWVLFGTNIRPGRKEREAGLFDTAPLTL